MAKRKKNLSITDTIAQHLETANPETVIIPEVSGVPEEKFQSVFEENKEEVLVEEKEEEREVVVKEEVLTSPHYKDPDTSAINLGISSIL